MLQFRVNTSEREDQTLIKSMSQHLDIDPVAARVLIRRGVNTIDKAERFLQADVWHDPFSMTGMDRAVSLLEQAIEENWSITVYGDYDCDGVCACSILYSVLSGLGADIHPYIPSRQVEGYGLNEHAIRRIAQRGGLLLTVDCGVTNVKEVALAKELGMQVIVTDHHQVLKNRPDCIIVDPVQDKAYPFQGLCGAGVALKLMEALTDGDVSDCLDLAAVATVADIVPLLDENRTIVTRGLKMMRINQRPGLRALAEVAGLRADQVTSGNLAFAIAPRINAAGRMGNAMRAFSLLTGDNPQMLQEIAEELDEANSERKQIERRIVAEATDVIERRQEASRTTIVSGKDWHPGVIGIAASKLVEMTGKPTAVISEDGQGICTGSVRGIPGVNIFCALDACKQYLIRYGGHAQAGGFSLKREDLKAFTGAMEAFFCREYQASLWGPVSDCDIEVELNEINLSLAESLSKLEPFGFGNPTPTVVVKNAQLVRRTPLGATGDHARLFMQKNGAECEIIAFRVREKDVPGADTLTDFSASVSVDMWNGQRQVQCLLRDIRPSLRHFVSMVQKERGLFGYGFASNCVCAGPARQAQIESMLKDCAEMPFGHLLTAFTPACALRMLELLYHQSLLETTDLCWGQMNQRVVLRNTLLIAARDQQESMHQITLNCDTEEEFSRFAASLFLSRSEMGRVYRDLASHALRPLRLAHRCKETAERTQTMPEQVGAAISIFRQLGFLLVEPMRLRINRGAEKRKLTENKAYCMLRDCRGGELGDE